MTQDLVSKRLSLSLLDSSAVPMIFKSFTHEVTQYMYPSPSPSIEGVVSFVNESIERMQDGVELIYVISHKVSHAFIGLVGLHNLHSDTPELGIWTCKEHHGHYYGREAIETVIRKARLLGYNHLLYPVDVRNIPSKKIPLSFNGIVTKPEEELITQDGRKLRIETYTIPL